MSYLAICLVEILAVYQLIYDVKFSLKKDQVPPPHF